MAVPNVPPRPSRSQQDGPSPVASETPLIPPRPLRKTDPSPDREAYTRSPLNSLPGSGQPHTVSSRSSQELPRRPPSVSLPSIGQEGSEYSSYDQLPEEAHGVVVESTASDLTTSVSADLPMHQPRASLPQSTAKRQIQTVTRTDSAQAAAAGIGRGPSTDDLHAGTGGEIGSPLGRSTSHTQSYLHSHHQHPYGGKRAASTERHPLRAKSSFNRSTSSLTPLERTTSRPSSVYGEDSGHGIPEIGQQIPLYPMAGDVQAPSPGPTQSQHAQGIGFFNDGSARAHARRKGSRQEFGPPGSYGMYHDQEHQDQFEKAWAAKHPEEAQKEGHYMDLPRPPSALSSAQLNMLVGQSGSGVGTSREAIGTPDEETAFMATNEYMTRLGSPMVSPHAPPTDGTKPLSTGSQPPASPMRKTYLSDGGQSEDEQAYHLAPPSRKTNKVTGGGEADARMDLGPHAFQEGGWINEHRDGAPILAADEILKRPGSAYMHAAVTPEHHFDEYDSDHGHQSRRSSLQPSSRPSSRPSSVHGGYHGSALHRYVSHEEPHHSGVHTPLAEIEEYEPLFPENEDGEPKPRAFKKRPELALHHFPSQDVWEDTPASLQYSTTVTTPDLERRQEALEAETAAATFETPAEEQRRRSQNPDGMNSDKKTFAKPHFKPGVLEDMHHDRPGVQRFPSSDVWEDTPESMRLETTVSGPQMDDMRSPPEQEKTADDEQYESGARPHIPSRPERGARLDHESKAGADDVRAREVSDLGASGRSKPSIPARPMRPARSEQADEDSAAAAAAAAAVATAPTPKAKPAVPARPGGEKIAALKAGFMNDLNNRLKLGPQALPPKKEVEVEAEEEAQKAPLADARKSRARGPARRKPAPPPVTELKSSTFALSPLVTVWSIDEEDELQVQPKEKQGEEKRPSTQETEQTLAANEAANTSEPAFVEPKDAVSATGAEGDVPEPSISAASAEKQQAIEPALEASLQRSEGAPESFEAREHSDLVSAKAQPTTMATASSGDQE